MISSLNRIELENPSGPDGSVLVPGSAFGKLFVETAPSDGRDVVFTECVGEVALPLLYWYRFVGMSDNLALLQACNEDEFKTNQKLSTLAARVGVIKRESPLNHDRLSLLKATNSKLLIIPEIGNAARNYLKEHKGEYRVIGENQGILAILFGLSVEGGVIA